MYLRLFVAEAGLLVWTTLTSYGRGLNYAANLSFREVVLALFCCCCLKSGGVWGGDYWDYSPRIMK